MSDHYYDDTRILKERSNMNTQTPTSSRRPPSEAFADGQAHEPDTTFVKGENDSQPGFFTDAVGGLQGYTDENAPAFYGQPSEGVHPTYQTVEPRQLVNILFPGQLQEQPPQSSTQMLTPSLTPSRPRRTRLNTALRSTSSTSTPQKNRPARRTASKRAREDDVDDDDNTSDADGTTQEGKKAARNTKKARRDQSPDDGPRFACPFFKHSPDKWKTKRACTGPGWSGIHRLKEHLYRQHSAPAFPCPRCSQPFKTHESLRIHSRSPIPCVPDSQEVHEGMNSEQMKTIKRRADPNLSDQQRWNDIYTILFPDCDADSLPSPYYDYETAETRSQGTQSPALQTPADEPRSLSHDVAQLVRGRFLEREFTSGKSMNVDRKAAFQDYLTTEITRLVETSGDYLLHPETTALQNVMQFQSPHSLSASGQSALPPWTTAMEPASTHAHVAGLLQSPFGAPQALHPHNYGDGAWWPLH